jgi:hypothetical protein
MNKFCIVIPIYKSEPDYIEEVSLKRLNTVIGKKNYNVYFVAYSELDLTKYYEFVNDLTVSPIFFDKRFFESKHTYSQLCINYDFYNVFSEYEYMYIYQTDCYLNTDNLFDFCELGYDYIGAPIMSTDCGWPTVTENKQGNKVYMPVIGNGGFSLRKIETFKDITNPNGEFIQEYNLTEDILKNVIWEDLYFCVTIKQLYDLNISPLHIGTKFAWDMSVDILYDFFKIKTLPMCIHAWDKNIRFWNKHIPELIENEEITNYCENKYKDFFKVYYDENNSTMR